MMRNGDDNQDILCEDNRRFLFCLTADLTSRYIVLERRQTLIGLIFILLIAIA